MADRKGGDGKPGDKSSGKPVVIKKYANRRLYNTATSSYVTLDHLCQMVKDGIEFTVHDAKSGEDITRPVLTQIIVEEEAKGTNLLPITFLRQLISLYGDNMQWLVPRYLEHMMGTFHENQERMRQTMRETLGGMFPMGGFEEMSKQNMAFFESAVRMFSPFAEEGAEGGQTFPGPKGPGGTAGGSDGEPKDPAKSLAALQEQLDLMQRQLAEISKVRPPDAAKGGEGASPAQKEPAAKPKADTRGSTNGSAKEGQAGG